MKIRCVSLKKKERQDMYSSVRNYSDADYLPYIKDEKIIAIDPGKAGGITVYSVTRKKVVGLVTMPETPMDLYGFLKKWFNNSRCYLEKVGGIPGMGASSMFNFGKGFGHLEMCLLVLKIPTTEVTPQKWQKVLQLGTKSGQPDRVWKLKLKTRAQQMFPTVEKDFNIKTQGDWLSVADSLLIAEYARITEGVK